MSSTDIEKFTIDECLEFLGQEKKWKKLSGSDLETLFLKSINYVGTTSEISYFAHFLDKLRALYPYFAEKVSLSNRRIMAEETRNLIINKEINYFGLTPFIWLENDLGLVSTSALDYAVLTPTKNEGLLDGPKRLIKMYHAGNFANGAAVLGGLLTLGDKRVMDLLKPLREQLNEDEVQTICNCSTGFLNSATVEFFLSWIEELKGDYYDSLFGILAAKLVRLARDAVEPVVASIERVFPSTPENCIRILKVWPIEEYGLLLKKRFQAIAKKEKEPRIFGHVLKAWGL